MGLLDLLRGAIAPTMAARTGFEAGQERGRDKRRRESFEDAEQRRRDEEEASQRDVRASQSAENRARADYYERGGASADGVQWVVDDQGNRVPLPKRLPASSPLSTIKEAIGGGTSLPPDSQDMTGADASPLATVRSAVSPQFEIGRPSGVKAPAPRAANPPRIDPNSTEGIEAARQRAENAARARQRFPAPSRARSGGSGSSSQDRLNAKTAYDEALKNVPRPSKSLRPVIDRDAKGRPAGGHNEPDPRVVADSNTYERTTLGPLRKHLMEVTAPGIVGASDSDIPAPATTPRVAPETMAAAQQEFDDVGRKLQTILASPHMTPEKKARARELYDQKVKEIAAKFGLPTGAR